MCWDTEMFTLVFTLFIILGFTFFAFRARFCNFFSIFLASIVILNFKGLLKEFCRIIAATCFSKQTSLSATKKHYL